MLNLNKHFSDPTFEHLSDTTSLDDLDRIPFLKSTWHSLIHPVERKGLDQAVLNQVKKIFTDKYNFQDSKAFDMVWKKIAAPVWTPSKELTAGALRSIDNEFKSRLIYHGKGIPSARTAASGPTSPIRQLVQTLLHGMPFPKNLINSRTLRAFLVEQNPVLLKEFRQEIQYELNNLQNNLPKTPEEEMVWRTFLGNLLGFVPYTYPQSGETITIPFLKDGVCKQVRYDMEVIPLKFNNLCTPLSAIAMTPKEKEEQAPPILSFIGTTFPSGTGFAASILSDFTPGYSVGEFAYETDQANIANWMENKKNVHAVGISLGGSLAFHALRHHHDKLARVDVYNPAGLYSNCWNEDLGKTCDVNIHWQPEDLVSELGFWPTQGNISSYEILQHQGLPENLFSSHVRTFSGSETITVIKHDPKKQNQSLRKKILTVLHKIFSFLIFVPVTCVLVINRIANDITKCVKRLFRNSFRWRLAFC
jgi:hypothetical protein